MRWFWIDRFTEFESGRRAAGVKCVSLSEDHMPDYVPGYPTMPASFIIEGIALVGGLLASEIFQFKNRVVLAKLSKAVYHFPAIPGDVLTYTATITDLGSEGTRVEGTSHCNGKLQAEAEIFLAFLPERAGARDLFTPVEYLRMLRILKLFDVARTREGNPVTIPDWLLEAEAADLAG